MIELWKPVVGYEGLYEVSDAGRVRSVERMVRHNYGGMKRVPSRILKAGAGEAGHLHVGLWRDNKMSNQLVHRLVATAFIGPPEQGMKACHNDGHPSNNRVENLRWDTQKGNLADRKIHGTNFYSNKTHCPQGHEYSDENTIWSGNTRRCRACAKKRSSERYQKVGQRGTRITHCPHGHEYDDANTYIYNGHRSCRACAKLAEQKRRDKSKTIRDSPQ